MADSSLGAFRYDEAGKCLDCGGLGGCHSLACAEKKAQSSLFSLRGRRRLRGVLVEAANGLKPCVADAWELLQTFDADTKLHELLVWADQFATHDPGVEWPSDKHTDPVDAICAALDRVREEAETCH